MPSPLAAARDRPLLGIAAMLGFTLSVALLDATAKHVTETLPVAMVLWCRYFAQFALFALFLGLIGVRRCRAVVRTRRLGAQTFRALILVIESGCVFYGLSLFPLAETIAVTFIYPFLVCLMAVPLLGERFGRWRLAAILIGFAGAVLVARPGGELFHPATLVVLFSAFLFALYQVLTRRLADSEPVATTLFYTAAGGALFSLPLALAHWQAPGTNEALLLLATGVLGLLAHGFLILAFSNLQASSAAAFGYVELIWALLLGRLFFGHWPDALSFLGIAVIAAAGLLVAWREQRAGRMRRRAAEGGGEAGA